MNILDAEIKKIVGDTINFKPLIKEAKPQKLERKDPKELIKTHKENSNKIEIIQSAKDELEQDFKKQHTKIYRTARYEIGIIEEWERDQYSKLTHQEEKQKSEIDNEIKDLQKPVFKIDKIIYFLRQQNKKIEFNFNKVEYRKYGEKSKAILLDSYEDKNLKLGLYICPNDRPVNKITLFITGDCRFGSSEYQTLARQIFNLDRDYGLNLDNQGFVCKELDYFPDEETARQKVKQLGIKELYRKFFFNYNKIKTEYEQVCNLYRLDEFQDIIKDIKDI